MDFHLSSFYSIFVFVLIVIGFAVVTLLMAHLLGPRKKTSVKEVTYESGMDPIGSARQKFDVKFYLIAILFLVFDVELLFLYPWAVSAYQSHGGEKLIPEALQWPVFWELLVFIATLVVAYVYAWRRGVFRWR
jgi:NADH-quinone oxidoreductase subunit A